MTTRQAALARVVSTLLGLAFLAGAGFPLYRAAASAAGLAALPTTHLWTLLGLAVLGAFLIDPAHVGSALAALIGYARAAKGVKVGESDTPEAP